MSSLTADRLNEQYKRMAVCYRKDLQAAEARLAETQKERDEWQELAVRLAEEAGVDAEAMLAQARVEEAK